MVPPQHCDLLCPAEQVHPTGDLPGDLITWFFPGGPHRGEKILKRSRLSPHQLQPCAAGHSVLAQQNTPGSRLQHTVFSERLSLSVQVKLLELNPATE